MQLPKIKLDPQIYKNNMEVLQQRYPDLAMMLSLVEIEKYQLIKIENCLPNVMINSQTYYIGNLQKYCEEQYKDFKLKNVKSPIFLGMGLGYEVMYWLQFMAKEHQTQTVVIIEKDLEMFQCAMNVSDLRPIISNPTIHLFVGLEINQLYNTFRAFFHKNMINVLLCGVTKPLFLYPAMKIGKEYYLKTLNIFYECLFHSIQNFGNCPEDSLIGVENMLDNVGEIVNKPGINLLYDKFKGKPAVIVATGPSLKKNWQLLKDIQDKALIFSCDASFKFLMQNGIKPHMVTSLEREHAVQEFFEDYDREEVKDVYMTACPVLFNHVYESYAGPKIIVYRNFDHFKWLQIERGILDIKLSSANMAFKIATALGCNPIILVGQDLAYAEDGVTTHVIDSVPYSCAGEDKFYVKGNTEEQILTTTGWYNFLKAYEFDISQYSGKVINCTEGGAYILGTKISTFKETIDKYITETFHPLQIIQDNLKAFTSDNVVTDMERLRGIIEVTEKEVSEIIRLCRSGVDVINKYKDELNKEITEERLEEIRSEVFGPRLKIQTEFNDTFQKFLMHVVQAYHLKFEMETVMNCTERKDILLNTIKWYSFIGDISQICLESLLKAKVKLCN